MTIKAYHDHLPIETPRNPPTHRQDVAFPSRPVAESVRQLDQLLNIRVLTAHSEAAVNAAMRLKGDIKRRLVKLPDEALESAAAAVLEELCRAA